MYEPDGGRGEAVGDCYFARCPHRRTVEAIGTYDAVLGTSETVAMILCDRHADIRADVASS
jgi:hypothetical protein